MSSFREFAPSYLSRMGQKIQGAQVVGTRNRIWAKALVLASLLCSPYLHLEAQVRIGSFATNLGGTNNAQHWSFLTCDGHIWDMVYTYGSWKYMDLTQAANAPLADLRSGLSSFATNYDQHWVFEAWPSHGSQPHIWQIVYTYSNGSFGYMDLTQAANAPPPGYASGTNTSLSSFVSNFATTATEQHFVFQTYDGHIWQIVYDGYVYNGSVYNGLFRSMDLTKAANAPPSLVGHGLSSFAANYDQNPYYDEHFVFETGEGHIWQIVYDGVYGYMDLTQAAKAPSADFNSGLSSFATNYDQHWVFETGDDHIWQIVYTYSNGSFGYMDLTQATQVCWLCPIAPSALLNVGVTFVAGYPEMMLVGSGLSSFATNYDQHWVFGAWDGLGYLHIWQIVYTYNNGSFGYMDLTYAANAYMDLTHAAKAPDAGIYCPVGS